VVLLIYLAVVVISIVATVKIVTKAGYSGWWVLVTIVPIVNFVMLLVFAFSEWPIVREVQALRAQAASWPGYGPPGFGPPGFGGDRPYPSGPTMPGDGGSAWTSGVPSSGRPPREAVEAEPPLPPFESIVPAAKPAQDRGPAPVDDRATTPQVERSPSQEAQAQPGWYPTPDGRVRYWDGTAWTDHFA
jgi:hypothetical protein